MEDCASGAEITFKNEQVYEMLKTLCGCSVAVFD